MTPAFDDERFRALIEQSLDAIALIRPDGAVVWVSPSVTRVLGYSPEEFVKFGPFEVVHPDDREAAAARLDELTARPGATQTALNRVRHKDGSDRWIETVSSNQLDRPGVNAVVANFRDVTARKRAEEALREREEHFRLIVESATDFAIFTLDLDGRVTSWNSGAERILGYTEPEILGRHVNIIFDDDDLARDRAAVEMGGALANGCATDDRWHVRKGGARFWANGLMMPLKDDAGATRGYLKILRDRTEHKLARESMLDIEKRLRIAVDAARLGCWHADLPLDKLVWDDRCKGHFWLPPGAEPSLAIFYERLHPDDREATRAAIDRAIADGSDYDTEFRTVADDGRVRWVQALGRTDAEGAGPHRRRRFDGVTIDVTRRKHDEEALRDMDRRKDEFLAMLAHELRNPLAAIRNAVTLAARSGARDDVEWGLGVIERQAGHFARLVDDLLDASRVTQGKIPIRREIFDPLPVVRDALEAVRPLAEHRRHEVVVSLPAEPLCLEADPTRLEQILVNLLTNAAKYTPHGGRIELAIDRESDEVVFRVRDNGLGIAPEMLPRLFDLFTQADRSLARSEGGLGIGLTLVKSLAEMHGGTVTATSAGHDQGSEFVVRLPAAAVPPADPAAAPASAAPAAAPDRPLKVLVVDDNTDTARGMARLLRLSGHTVAVAHTGAEALASARSDPPELVLLDIGLPGMDGFEVARALREGPCPDALLFACSGYGDDTARRHSAEAGFDRHFLKPVDLDALYSALSGPRPCR